MRRKGNKGRKKLEREGEEREVKEVNDTNEKEVEVDVPVERTSKLPRARSALYRTALRTTVQLGYVLFSMFRLC